MLNDFSKQLDTLFRPYDPYDDGSFTCIGTHMRLSGDPMNFIFIQEDDKYSRLTTTSNFAEWMSCTGGGWTEAAPAIDALVAPYGAKWDKEHGVLYLRFRRNEMSIAQAILRMQQAASVICNLVCR